MGRGDGQVTSDDPNTTTSIPTSLGDLVDGVSDSAIEFLKNPRAWIASLVVGWVLDAFGFFGLKIQQTWGLFIGILEGSGGSVYDSIAFVGGSILGVFTGFESALADLAASSPLGLVVALLIWIAVAYAAVYVVTWLWSALKTAIPLVIPWL